MAQIAEFDQLMADVAAGSDDAIWQLAETYTPYIIRAVRLSLSPQLRQKLDSQDFAQTLWKSILFRRTDLARLTNPEQLIAYLARATRNKVIDKARHFKSEKRSIAREENLDARLPATRATMFKPQVRELYSRDPSPSTSASLRERWNQILSNSSERDRRILQLRLEGCTFDTISAKLQINEATGRRAIQRLIEQLSE